MPRMIRRTNAPPRGLRAANGAPVALSGVLARWFGWLDECTAWGMKHISASLASLASLAFAGLVGFALPAHADDVAGNVSSSVSPQGKSLGLGVQLGAPTSLNLKLMLSDTNAVVVGLGGGIWYDASLSLHADYLWHPFVAQFDDGAFSAYIGVGAWTSLGYEGQRYGYYRPFASGPFSAGARLPLGLTVAFNQVPVEVFGEIVPAVALFPGIGVFGQGGLGARFYF